MLLNPIDLWNTLPLAESFWLLLRQVWPSEQLDTFYAQHRGRGYQRDIAFSELVDILLEAITLRTGHAHPVLADRQDKLPASLQAVYGKLRRMPRTVSHALIPADANRHRELLPAHLQAPTDAKGIHRFRQLVFDGHSLKRASKRMKAARRTPGRALGGKILAVLELQSDLVVGLSSDAHAHVNEQALLPDLLDQVRATLPGPRLWIGDRAFGNLANFKRCTAKGDHCILRKTIQSTFRRGDQPTVTGTDASGRTVHDEIGLFSSAREGEQAARQITVERSGDKPLVIVTSLLDRDEYPANDVLELYRKRWSIEQKFQKVTELFKMGPYCSSTPNGILFHAALCLMLSNNLTVLQTLMAAEQKREAKTVSTQKLFEELRDQLVVCRKLLTTETLLATLQMRRPLAGQLELLVYVRSLLQRAWHRKFAKSPGKKRHLPKVKHKRGAAGHFSIQKAIAKAQTVKAKKTKAAATPPEDV